MSKYTISFRGGPYDGKILEHYEFEYVKPGDAFIINGATYHLLDTNTARLSYDEGATPNGLACGAVYINPEDN